MEQYWCAFTVKRFRFDSVYALLDNCSLSLNLLRPRVLVVRGQSWIRFRYWGLPSIRTSDGRLAVASWSESNLRPADRIFMTLSYGFRRQMYFTIVKKFKEFMHSNMLMHSNRRQMDSVHFLVPRVGERINICALVVHLSSCTHVCGACVCF